MPSEVNSLIVLLTRPTNGPNILDTRDQRVDQFAPLVSAAEPPTRHQCTTSTTTPTLTKSTFDVRTYSHGPKMTSSPSLELEDANLIEDLFDGWLAIPSITGFLADPSSRPPPKQITEIESTKCTPEHSPKQLARVPALEVEEDTDHSYEATTTSYLLD